MNLRAEWAQDRTKWRGFISREPSNLCQHGKTDVKPKMMMMMMMNRNFNTFRLSSVTLTRTYSFEVLDLMSRIEDSDSDSRLEDSDSDSRVEDSDSRVRDSDSDSPFWDSTTSLHEPYNSHLKILFYYITSGPSAR